MCSWKDDSQCVVGGMILSRGICSWKDNSQGE